MGGNPLSLATIFDHVILSDLVEELRHNFKITRIIMVAFLERGGGAADSGKNIGAF